MLSYKGEATIVQGDERTDLDHCSLETEGYPDPGAGPLPGWLGRYSIANPVSEPEPGDASLELPDGRKGRIILTRVVTGSGFGEFRGNGRFPNGA